MMRRLAVVGALALALSGCAHTGLGRYFPSNGPAVKDPGSKVCVPCQQANAANAALSRQKIVIPATTAAPATPTTASTAVSTGSSTTTGSVPSAANLQAAGIPTKCLRREITQATCQRDGLPYG